MKQLDFLEAAAQRDAGILQAADHAGCDWQSDALEAFRRYAVAHEHFLTEDVRLASVWIVPPPSQRAWGAVAKNAEKRGYVVQDGFGYAKQSHLSPVVRWKSLVFKP